MMKNLYPDHYGKVVFLLSMAIFIAATFPSRAQSVKTQVISTYAGDGGAGYAGNNGPATLAKLDSPTSIAIDAAGNLYISDQENNTIRKVMHAPSCIISTIAGSRTPSYGGDNGPATLAMLNLNWGVAVDGSGNIYISDEQNQRIRKVDASGIITTIAGTGTGGYSGDNGPATAALIQYPLGIAVDRSGNVFFGDSYNSCIRKIDAAGIITTIAGTGSYGFSGDGGPASIAKMSLPWGVAVDAAGNVYFCDVGNQRIREINTAGIISTIAGNGTPGYYGDGGPAISAYLNQPLGLTVSNSGEVYIADYYNNRVRKVSTAGIISTIAGTGIQGYNGDGIPATVAQLSHPISVAVDDSDHVYITDLDNVRIRKIGNANILSFLNGRYQSITVCENTTSPINPALTIVDYDTGPTDTWSLLTAPMHGSVVASYSTGSTGGATTPVGLVYTPDTNYTGNDSFTVRVTNGTASDTTTVYVTVNTLYPSAGVIKGANYVCEKSVTQFSDAVTGGVWSSSDTMASVSSTGAVTGISAGVDSILYTYNNSCATAVTTKTITVEPLPDAGKIIGASAVCSGSTIMVTDTIAGGTWSCSNGTAKIDSGLITGVSSGVDTVIYTVSNAFCKAKTTELIVIDTFTDIGVITGDTGVCVGAKITLADAAVHGGIWTSRNSSATVASGIIIGVYPGIDTIDYSITNACGTAMASKIITVYPSPDTPFINQNEYTLWVPGTYSSYQWVRNGAGINGAIADTYLVTNGGTYSVIVTNSFGCPVTSHPVTSPDCSTDEINVYPNPTQSIVYVKWCKTLTIRIITMDGKVLPPIVNSNEADLSDLANGDYMLSIFDGNGARIKTMCVSKIAK